ncbi:MAG: MoaD family protein [Candidatus Helarchaeota archaeon]
MKLLALFYNQIGQHELQYEADTVGEILEKFIEEYGASLDNTLLNPETRELQHYILILVNGRNIRFLDGRNTSLKDGDVVAISPPIAGGAI